MCGAGLPGYAGVGHARMPFTGCVSRQPPTGSRHGGRGGPSGERSRVGPPSRYEPASGQLAAAPIAREPRGRRGAREYSAAGRTNPGFRRIMIGEGTHCPGQFSRSWSGRVRMGRTRPVSPTGCCRSLVPGEPAFDVAEKLFTELRDHGGFDDRSIVLRYTEERLLGPALFRGNDRKEIAPSRCSSQWHEETAAQRAPSDCARWASSTAGQVRIHPTGG